MQRTFRKGLHFAPVHPTTNKSDLFCSDLEGKNDDHQNIAGSNTLVEPPICAIAVEAHRLRKDPVVDQSLARKARNSRLRPRAKGTLSRDPER